MRWPEIGELAGKRCMGGWRDTRRKGSKVWETAPFDPCAALTRCQSRSRPHFHNHRQKPPLPIALPTTLFFRRRSIRFGLPLAIVSMSSTVRAVLNRIEARLRRRGTDLTNDAVTGVPTARALISVDQSPDKHCNTQWDSDDQADDAEIQPNRNEP